jgi:glycosyltransferase involved in cell wall biosynthesis
MRVALVHDWLNNLGGAERVLIELHKIFPEAPIYTLFYDKKFVTEHLPDAVVIPSFLQRIIGIRKIYRALFFLMPAAVESFNFSGFDVVLSSSAIFSKGIVVNLKTKHICYCYSPTRQLWDLNSDSKIGNWKLGIGNSLARHILRMWDRQAAMRVDEFVAISDHVKQRIDKYYKRDSRVIYPPMTVEPASLSLKRSSSLKNGSGSYFLIVSRLFPHKNIGLAIDTFKKLGLPLLIIGKGPEMGALRKATYGSKNIKILGFIKDSELLQYYRNCKAFIMPQEEDFGLTPLEAMSFGKPVLALRKGGATETMIENITGEFFDDPIPEALADGVRRLNDNYHRYRPELIKSHVQKFSRDKFRSEILGLIGKC